MGRLRLHRNEYETTSTRLFMLVLITVLFGTLSGFITRFVSSEASSLAGFVLTSASEWHGVVLSNEIPVALGLFLIPALTSLIVGTHTLHQGGIVGFFISIFNIPVEGNYMLGQWSGSPLVWVGFILGLLAAFYIGDLGSWLCRKRLSNEACEDELKAILENPNGIEA